MDVAKSFEILESDDTTEHEMAADFLFKNLEEIKDREDFYSLDPTKISLILSKSSEEIDAQFIIGIIDKIREKNRHINVEDFVKSLNTQRNFIIIHYLKDKQYRCPQCRLILFKGENIIPHEATKVRKFAKKRRDFGSPEDTCSSFFTEQPEWLDATGRIKDVIYCPKCQYKLGHFNWVGGQCSCGEWVKPSFQFPISRVDSV